MSGTAVKAQVTTIGGIVDKKYKKLQKENNNLVWEGERLSKNAKLWNPPPYRFSVGPIPVSLKTSVSGRFMIQPKASLTNILSFDTTNLRSNAKAKASLMSDFAINAEVSGKADVRVVSAGIESNLEVIQATIPFQADANANEIMKGLPPKLQVAWKANVLAGKISVVVKTEVEIVETVIKWFGSLVGIKIKSLRYEKEIYNFNGFHFGDKTKHGGGFALIYCSRASQGCFVEVPREHGDDDVIE